MLRPRRAAVSKQQACVPLYRLDSFVGGFLKTSSGEGFPRSTQVPMGSAGSIGGGPASPRRALGDPGTSGHAKPTPPASTRADGPPEAPPLRAATLAAAAGAASAAASAAPRLRPASRGRAARSSRGVRPSQWAPVTGAALPSLKCQSA